MFVQNQVMTKVLCLSDISFLAISIVNTTTAFINANSAEKQLMDYLIKIIQIIKVLIKCLVIF